MCWYLDAYLTYTLQTTNDIAENRKEERVRARASQQFILIIMLAWHFQLR